MTKALIVEGKITVRVGNTGLISLTDYFGGINLTLTQTEALEVYKALGTILKESTSNPPPDQL